MNKLCDVASCWIYEYTGVLLGVHCILHISSIGVKLTRVSQLYAYCYNLIQYMHTIVLDLL
jgi:hypothetical protein